MPEEIPVSLRDFIERVLKERERTFTQFMASQKEATDHLRTESKMGLASVMDKIHAMENRLNRAEGTSLGKKDVWGYVLAIVGFGLAAAIAIFNHLTWQN